MNYGGYDVKISDTGHVVYAAYYIDVDFSSDGSGTGAGFIASVSYLGESDITAVTCRLEPAIINYIIG